jgi:tetratricopeptide (TPR) repeat protein
MVKLRIRLFILLATAMLVSAASSKSQTSNQDDPQRRHAFELYDEGNMADAMPLLEQLAATYPTDIPIHERWAFSTMAYSAALKDPAERVKARARARKLAVEAQKLGDNSPLLQVILELPEDGSEKAMSDRKEVDEAMQAGEAEFVHGNYDKARENYLRALLLDPNEYEAALFTGDVYFKQHVYGSAGEWFSRAIQINPDRETAYRYWGDALAAMGKIDEARSKYIEAVIAEPYDRKPWQALAAWAQHTKTTVHWVKLNDRANVTAQDDKNITLTVDNNLKSEDLSGAGWIAYGGSRAAWRIGLFQKQFPNEPKYRHSLKEEADSLETMIKAVRDSKDFSKKSKDLDPSLLDLIKIDESGFLEPFVLLNRVDAGIAQDYPGYRAAHREKLRQYLDQFVVPQTPTATQP